MHKRRPGTSLVKRAWRLLAADLPANTSCQAAIVLVVGKIQSFCANLSCACVCRGSVCEGIIADAAKRYLSHHAKPGACHFQVLHSSLAGWHLASSCSTISDGGSSTELQVSWWHCPNVMTACCHQQHPQASSPNWCQSGHADPSPIAVDGSLSSFTLLVLTFSERLPLLHKFIRHYSQCASVRLVHGLTADCTTCTRTSPLHISHTAGVRHAKGHAFLAMCRCWRCWSSGTKAQWVLAHCAFTSGHRHHQQPLQGVKQSMDSQDASGWV